MLKRLYSTESLEYLSVKIDENLTWQQHISDHSVKLNRANAWLFTMRTFVDNNLLRSKYFALFESYLNNCSCEWAQNTNTINCIVILQEKKHLELWAFNIETLTLVLHIKNIASWKFLIKMICKIHYFSVNISKTSNPLSYNKRDRNSCRTSHIAL